MDQRKNSDYFKQITLHLVFIFQLLVTINLVLNIATARDRTNVVVIKDT